MTELDHIARRAAAALRNEVAATVDVEARLSTIGSRAPADVAVLRRRWAWIGSAAVLVLGIGAGAVVLVRDGDPEPPAATTPAAPDVSGSTPATVLVPAASTIPAPTLSTVILPTSSATPSTSAPTTSSSSSTTTSTSSPPATGIEPIVGILTLDASGTVFGRGAEVDLAPCSPNACPSVAVTSTGALVAYDAVANVLQVGAIGSVFETVAVPIAEDLDASFGDLALIGPDDVAYLAVQPAHVLDPVGDLVAVSLSGPNAGAVVGRADGVLDMSGDSDLVATAGGVVQVGCCGPGWRPEPDAAPVMTWVDRSGLAVNLEGAQVSFQLLPEGFRVVRTEADGSELSWTLPPTVFAPRGTPESVALPGGDVLAVWDDVTLNEQFVMRFEPSGEIERLILRGETVVALDPYGAAITFDGERFRYRRLPTFADQVVLTDLGSLAVTGATPDEVLDGVVAKLSSPASCEGAPPSVTVTGRTGTDPVVASVRALSGCDDSVAGFELETTIRSSADGRWAIVEAKRRQLCLRGSSGELCV